jgi:hypothetical protein
MGSGGNTIATSADGKTWTGLGTSIFSDSGLSADWNGYAWLVSGKGTNTLAYSTDNTALTQWVGLGNSVFSEQCNSVRWMMNKWVAVGSGGSTMAYTESKNGQSGWVGNSLFTTACKSVFWNGSIAVALGSGEHTIATSTNGIDWVGQGSSVFSSSGTSVMWNTRRWIATGIGGNTVVYSYDGIQWLASPDTNSLFTQVLCVGTNSRIGAATVNSGLRLNANDRFAVNTPAAYDYGLSPETVISFQMNL